MIFSRSNRILASGKVEDVFINTNKGIGDFQFFYDVILIVDGVKYSISTSDVSAIAAGDDVKMVFVSDANDNRVVSLVNLSNGSIIESSSAEFYQLGMFLVASFLIISIVVWPQVEMALVFVSFCVVSSYFTFLGWRVKKVSKMLASQKS